MLLFWTLRGTTFYQALLEKVAVAPWSVSQKQFFLFLLADNFGIYLNNSKEHGFIAFCFFFLVLSSMEYEDKTIFSQRNDGLSGYYFVFMSLPHI